MVQVLPPSDEAAVAAGLAARLNESQISILETLSNGTKNFHYPAADSDGCAALGVASGSSLLIWARMYDGGLSFTKWTASTEVERVSGVHHVVLNLGDPQTGHYDCFERSSLDVAVHPLNVTAPMDVELQLSNFRYSDCDQVITTTAWSAWLVPDDNNRDLTKIITYAQSLDPVVEGDAVPASVNITIGAPGNWAILVITAVGWYYEAVRIVTEPMPGVSGPATMLASNVTVFADGAEAGAEQWDIATTLDVADGVPYLVGDRGWKISETEAFAGTRSWWAETPHGGTTRLTSKPIAVPDDGHAHLVHFAALAGPEPDGILAFRILANGQTYWSETFVGDRQTWVEVWRDVTGLAGRDVRLEFSHSLPACNPATSCPEPGIYLDDVLLR